MNEDVMSNIELYHYGIKGMKWGVRRGNKVEKKPQHQKADRRKSYENNNDINRHRPNDAAMSNKKSTKTKARKTMEIGGSVCAGLLSGSLGSMAVFNLTGSDGIANLVAPSLAVIGGIAYHDWISS